MHHKELIYLVEEKAYIVKCAPAELKRFYNSDTVVEKVVHGALFFGQTDAAQGQDRKQGFPPREHCKVMMQLFVRYDAGVVKVTDHRGCAYKVVAVVQVSQVCNDRIYLEVIS